MRVGMIGLGKLGLPVALAMEAKGHEVYGSDTSREVQQIVIKRRIPYEEAGAQELLEKSRLEVCTTYEMVESCELIFCAVQTPHAPQYEGATPLPDTRADFDYKYLVQACQHVNDSAERLGKSVLLVVISTVLPGTIRREIKPWLGRRVRLLYNPFFIAMGTCIADFLDPEFVLIGSEDWNAAVELETFYGTLHDKPRVRMSIEEAELTKVAYNTYITSKIVFANTLMEICEKMGADVDKVTDALGYATDRVISPKYLKGGMGDGGGCHPRDNIALSWLARELDLSCDLFGSLMEARERQTAWLAELLFEEASDNGLPIAILGKAFKAGSNLTVGSPALLLRQMANEPVSYDPHVDREEWRPSGPYVFFIGTNHAEFKDFPFPNGSVVIDPWGYIPERPGVRVRRIGRRSDGLYDIRRAEARPAGALRGA